MLKLKGFSMHINRYQKL